jgi:hypothetical protein
MITSDFHGIAETRRCSGKNNVPGVLMPGEFENGGKDEEER